MLSRGGLRFHRRTQGQAGLSRALTQRAPFNRIVKRDPKWLTKTVPTRELLDRFREQELCRKLRKDDKWEYLAEAYDTVALLQPDQSDITLGQIEQVLPKSNPIAWTMIDNLSRAAPDPYLQQRTKVEMAACQFLRVHGIGIVLAKRLAAAGLRTLDDLAAWPEVTDSQMLSLNHLSDMDKMIPRLEMESFKARLEEVFYSKRFSEAPDVAFEIVGPYRCDLEYSPNINILVYSDGYVDLGAKTSVLDYVYHRVMGEGLIERGQMLSVETGDGFLWRMLRGQAKRRGYRLYRNNVEWGPLARIPEGAGAVEVVDRPPQPQTEKEVFDLADIPYLQPHQRTYSVYRNILPATLLEQLSTPWNNEFLKSQLRKQNAEQ
ncbi:hypothetical protein CspeluHIS016_0601410 [Cutaneotrichosporon spelunceum]|uniref:DNA polymerase lambda fingers domain-containing protein n=1 Tax=Cutaneotrichosporon spelunceum TaxID=1672016 RepID=A0AAD3TY78_9TREE|nr:hypothetical protein CspeluHIS016_0601410 [Cutaneotrichosporon spelunceum]